MPSCTWTAAWAPSFCARQGWGLQERQELGPGERRYAILHVDGGLGSIAPARPGVVQSMKS